MIEPTSAALVRDAAVSRPEALADVREVRDERGARIVQLRLDAGWHIDVHVDRGFDIGAAWWRGRPISWRSPIPVDPGAGRPWADRFLGGLITTCGTDNIGPAHAGSGEHGRHSLTPATVWTWSRIPGATGWRVELRARIEDVTLAGRRVVVERTIAAATGDDSLEVHDTVINEGEEPAPVALLYHVNLGAPMVVPGTRIDTGSTGVAIRDDGGSPEWADRMPSRVPGVGVFEHREPVGTASLTTPEGSAVVLEWDRATLPRLYQWVWPSAGVVALEPANAPLFGAERESPHAGAPLLAPADGVSTRLCLRVRTRA